MQNKLIEQLNELKKMNIIIDFHKNETIRLANEFFDINKNNINDTSTDDYIIETDKIKKMYIETKTIAIELIQIYEQMRNEIKLNIYKLHNDIYVSILIKRYLEFKNIRDVANALNYTDRHITRLEKLAINELNNIVNNNKIKQSINNFYKKIDNLKDVC